MTKSHVSQLDLNIMNIEKLTHSLIFNIYFARQYVLAATMLEHSATNLTLMMLTSNKYLINNLAFKL